MTDFTTLEKRADRADLRMDNHGNRIAGLETREAARDELVKGLVKSVDRFSTAMFSIGGMLIFAVISIGVLDRITP